MNRKGIVVFTKVLLDVMFYSGILVTASLPFTLKLVTASLPFTLKLAGKYYSQDFAEHYIPMLAVFLVSGVCGLVIVYQLRKMIRTVIARDCSVLWKEIRRA